MFENFKIQNKNAKETFVQQGLLPASASHIEHILKMKTKKRKVILFTELKSDKDWQLQSHERDEKS